VLAYRPPLSDIRFSLDLVAPKLHELPGFDHADPSIVDELLAEFAKLCASVIAPTNETGDRQGLIVDTAASTITTPDGFKEAYKAYVAGGWGAVAADPTYGGGGFPHTIGLAISEMLESSNMAFALCPMLTQGSIDALSHWGSESQKERYLARLVSGEWTGTMNLSEPDAGSDVGALRTRAELAADGTWRITGQKIYITWGEHDLTENIVHLVLARVEGSPAGTKGISCFIVPKFAVNDDGALGSRNDVRVVSTEHKMGIHASPTCVLAFGDGGEGAVGELIGEVNDGMRVMFTMMNNARLAVGQQGPAISERAHQLAAAHALSRVQSRVAGSNENGATISGHPDVRRMLFTMKAYTESQRHLVFANANALDESRALRDPDARLRAAERADLLIPLSKAWCTDLGNEVASIGVQVFGGMGFCEDTGAAQLYRDIRIAAIYEGTNGIQALDLIGRKLGLRNGSVVTELLDEIRTCADDLPVALAASLLAAVDAATTTSTWLRQAMATSPRDAMAGATPYLRLLATTVGGWLMARQYLAASGSDDVSIARRATAEFFLTQLLPPATALASQVTAGVGVFDSVTDAALASR
jgi:3-(methylthio)propanoyl-CoA dehydrogenase